MNIKLQRLKQVMTAQTYKNDVAANNLANINTNGFKKDIMFMDVLAGAEENVKMKVQTDFSQGTLKETGNPLDLALNGNGFFSVERNGETHFSRDGHFSVDNEGFLITSAGHHVLGEGGWIHLALDGEKVGEVSVSQVGEVFVNDELMDTLQLVDFKDYNKLSKAGDNLFKSAIGAGEHVAENILVMQGNLEGSNVSPVNEMIGLMNIQRSFESSQRAVKTIDEALRKAANEIGRYR